MDNMLKGKSLHLNFILTDFGSLSYPRTQVRLKFGLHNDEQNVPPYVFGVES